MNDSFKKIAKTIKKSNSIALFTHISPDMDALGSSMSLYYAIKSLGKKVSIFVKDNITETQATLVDTNVFEKDCNQSEYDLFISTDTPSQKRLGDYAKIFIAGQRKIVLDHHLNDDLKGDLNFVDTSYSSCSEISYQIIKELKVKITPQISSYVFMGLSSDTNTFTNSNTNASSFKTAYELTLAKADITNINELLYKTHTTKEIDLKKFLYNNYHLENGICFCLVTCDDLMKLNATKADCDFFSSELINMQGANFAFSIIESTPSFYEISLRSKHGYNVRDVAEKFGGGGHICAAGAKLKYESIEKLKDTLVDAIMHSGE